MQDEHPTAVRARFSRRQLFRSAAVAVGAAALLAETSTPALALMPQKAAGYQDMPKGKQMCSNCSHFEPPAACGLVAGKISAKGWCRFYAAKS